MFQLVNYKSSSRSQYINFIS